jgi:uncharacterized protein (TIGR02453 family)
LPAVPSFTPAAFTFLRGLARHNEKPWFEAHRAQYEAAVLAPMREFVEEVDVRLATLIPELEGHPKRSLFRIHRDVRFSRNKQPYKTNAACQFFHRDAGRTGAVQAAGLYFQIAPGDSFVAGGIWMPPRPQLQQLRDALIEDVAGFEAVVLDRGFRRRFGGLDEEGMLVRLPRGVQPGHPAERWLRFTSFTVTQPLADADVLAPRLADRVAKAYSAMVPLIRWLNGALGFSSAAAR